MSSAEAVLLCRGCRELRPKSELGVWAGEIHRADAHVRVSYAWCLDRADCRETVRELLEQRMGATSLEERR